MHVQLKLCKIKTKLKYQAAAIVLVLLVTVGLNSCSKSTAYFEEYIEIPDQTWKQTNVPFFEFDISDTLQRYDMYFNIRHNKAYEWKNIWVFLTFEVPGGQIDRDTLEFVLQDGQSKWLGTSSGDIRDGSFLFKTKARFPYIGKYKASFEQAMRTHTVEDITDIGLRLEEVKP